MENRVRGNGLTQALRWLLATLFVCLAFTAQAEAPRVQFETDAGNFVLELYPDKAPKTVENFLAYVDAGFYDNTIFHRVIRNFVVQGGGYDLKTGEKKTRPPVPNEAKNGLKNDLGSIAMARTSDPNSATAQFYINLRNNASLDYPSFDGWGYAVFGRVVEGLSVVQAMGEVKTGVTDGMPDVPVKPIVVKSAKRVTAASAKK